MMVRIARKPALLCLMVLLLVGCGEEEVAENPVFVPAITPTTIADLPEEVQTATIEIESGRFAASELVLQEDEPVVLTVVNVDDEPYRFRIAEDLVTTTDIAAESTTEIEFTAPTPAVYEGHLLAAEGDEVLDTMEVAVLGPGGVQP